MRFLVDAQLPTGLARWLRGEGHDAQHVSEIGLASAPDAQVWAKARELDAVLITKDEDFAVLGESNVGVSAVVWLRLGNATNRVLLPWFARAFPRILDAIANEERVIEVR